MIPFFVFLFCLFATYAAYLLMTRKTATYRVQMQRRFAEALSYTAMSDTAAAQLSRQQLLSEIPQLDQMLAEWGPAMRLQRLIEQADLRLTVVRLCLFSLAAGVLGALTVSMLVITTAPVVAAGIAAAAGPFAHVLWKRKQRLSKFLADLPEALELMSRAMAAGHSFPDALGMVATEISDPIAGEFRRTYEEQNLGLSLRIALESLAQRVPLVDMRLCITAIIIQRETGGNLAEILDKVADTIRDRFRIFEELKTLTMQSRMSAWVLCGVPIFIAGMVTFLNPEYMSVMWLDPRGQKLAMLAVVMQCIGIWMVRRIIDIKI